MTQTYGYVSDKEALAKRLHRIEGQVRGIERMVEDERYCIDILTQISAVTTALESLAFKILDDHVSSCVSGALASGDPDVAAEKSRELLAARAPLLALALVPRYLTAATVALAAWVAVASGEPWTGVLPAAVIVVLALVDYLLWERRGRPWHDWTVILLLLPAIFSAVWVGVGGLLLDVGRTDGSRLALEVGPGVGLTGLLCTLISYHGRHHPDEALSDRASRASK